VKLSRNSVLVLAAILTVAVLLASLGYFSRFAGSERGYRVSVEGDGKTLDRRATGASPSPIPAAQSPAAGQEAPAEAKASSEIETQLRDYFKGLEASDPEMQKLQAERLRRMRENPGKYLPKLVELFDSIDEHGTYSRYKVLFIIEQLDTSLAIPFLQQIAASAAPAVPRPQPGEQDVLEQRQQVLVRMRAAGGLAALARSGNGEARAALLDVIAQSSDRAVRSDAISGYLASSKDLAADREYLLGVLPEPDRKLLDAKSGSLAVPKP
jgi:hypothetical protein